MFLRAPVLGTYVRARPICPSPSLVGASPKPLKRSNGRFSCALRAHVLACLCAKWRVLRSGRGSFCVAPSFSRFFGGSPPSNPRFLSDGRFLWALRAHVLACLCVKWRVLRWGYRSFLRGVIPAACRPSAGSVRAWGAPACVLSPAAAFPAVGRPFSAVPG